MLPHCFVLTIKWENGESAWHTGSTRHYVLLPLPRFLLPRQNSTASPCTYLHPLGLIPAFPRIKNISLVPLSHFLCCSLFDHNNTTWEVSFFSFADGKIKAQREYKIPKESTPELSPWDHTLHLVHIKPSLLGQQVPPGLSDLRDVDHNLGKYSPSPHNVLYWHKWAQVPPEVDHVLTVIVHSSKKHLLSFY